MPATAASLPLAAALEDSEPLARLMARMRDSRHRLEVVSPLLPAALRADVRAGPIDDAAWVLLVPNPAAAAKLRQLLPALAQALADAGCAESAIKIKVQPRGGR